MTRRMVSIGECMVEMSATGEGTFRLGFAGDTFNAAWHARRALPGEWTVAYFTAVGDDSLSRRMLTFMAEQGVETDRIRRLANRRPGLYLIELNNGERSFTYWRDNSAAKRLADDPAVLAQALRGVGIAYFSGITLGILPEAGRGALLEALKTAQRTGTQVVFDPNLRPRLWPSTRVMCDAIEAAAEISDLILPSFDDEETFFGDLNPEATIARYLARGARQVVVKAGGKAVHFRGADGAGVVDGLELAVPVDTTSAGDSFNAGYLAARIGGHDVAGAIRQAHELSRRVIGHHGALVAEAVTAST